MPQTERIAGLAVSEERNDPAIGKVVLRSTADPRLTAVAVSQSARMIYRNAVNRIRRFSTFSSRSRAGCNRARRSTRSSSPRSIRPGRGKSARFYRRCRGMHARRHSCQRQVSPPLSDDFDSDGRRVLGDFRIVREIGRGGMGIVYEADVDAALDDVALKILPSAAALDPRAIQRFQLEAQVAGWLQHPRIVPVYAVGVVNEVPYFAMQLINGGSLGGLIAELRGLVEHTTGPSLTAPPAIAAWPGAGGGPAVGQLRPPPRRRHRS